jgi:hypothetical protein
VSNNGQRSGGNSNTENCCTDNTDSESDPKDINIDGSELENSEILI